MKSVLISLIMKFTAFNQKLKRVLRRNVGKKLKELEQRSRRSSL
jgi:hypothetical protein